MHDNYDPNRDPRYANENVRWIKGIPKQSGFYVFNIASTTDINVMCTYFVYYDADNFSVLDVNAENNQLNVADQTYYIGPIIGVIE